MAEQSGVWVFGYGSLVSPASFGHTLGRELRPGVDFLEAEIAGWGRRWNYGVRNATGSTVDESGAARTWTIVALGVVESAGETTNGVVAWVADHELPALDRRELNYDRVDVTARARVHAPAGAVGRIVTYVPRDEPRRHYEAARDRGEAAVDRRYWDLVEGAFGDLGDDRRTRYLSTTPPPDVPILEMERSTVPDRYRVVDGR